MLRIMPETVDMMAARMASRMMTAMVGDRRSFIIIGKTRSAFFRSGYWMRPASPRKTGGMFTNRAEIGKMTASVLTVFMLRVAYMRCEICGQANPPMPITMQVVRTIIGDQMLAGPGNCVSAGLIAAAFSITPPNPPPTFSTITQVAPIIPTSMMTACTTSL